MQCEGHLFADLGCKIGRLIEVTGCVMRQWLELACLATFEKKELKLRPRIEAVTHIGCALELALEDAAWIGEHDVDKLYLLFLCQRQYFGFVHCHRSNE